MKSKMSFFNPTLLKKNVGRFAPAWALYLVALILSGPVALLRQLEDVTQPQTARALAQGQLQLGVILGFFFSAAAALVFAALVFKYLHGTRSAYMLHAFPMTRTCLFVTNALSGLAFWLVPNLIVSLLDLAVLGSCRALACWPQVFANLGMGLLAFLLFYGLAVFTMHISGNSVIAVLSYGALNFLFLVLPLMVLLLMGIYFRGFDYAMSERLLRLAPLLELLTHETPNLAMLWLYAGIGLVLLVLAWVHYRFRQVERAGDAMVYGWSRVAFRVIFTLCCALGLGWVLAALFSFFDTGRDEVFLPYALVGCVLGWFGSSMMVERTVKVFKNKKVWLGLAVCAAVLVVTVLGMKYDLLGLQRRVPETDRVAAVEIWTQGDYADENADRLILTQPEDIDVVRAVHRKAVETYTTTQRGPRELFGYSGSVTLHIRYQLANGATLRRAYELSASDLDSLAALYFRPDLATAWYDRVLPKDFREVRLEVPERYEVDDSYEVREFICKDPAALRQAVLADAAAGRLPVVNFITRSADRRPEYVPSGSSFLGGDQLVWLDDVQLYFFFRDGTGWFLPIADTASETIALFEVPEN